MSFKRSNGRAWLGFDGNKDFYGIIPSDFRLSIPAILSWHIVQYRGVRLRTKCEDIKDTFDARIHMETFLIPVEVLTTNNIAARDMQCQNSIINWCYLHSFPTLFPLVSLHP